MEFCELEGPLLDIGVAVALGYVVKARGEATWIETADQSEEGGLIGYIGGDHVPLWQPSVDWAQGGPLLERFQIHLSGPESRVHRNGGPNAGWGKSGLWGATSWKLRNAEGWRGAAYHETSQLAAAMRLIVQVSEGKPLPLPTGEQHE